MVGDTDLYSIFILFYIELFCLFFYFIFLLLITVIIVMMTLFVESSF